MLLCTSLAASAAFGTAATANAATLAEGWYGGLGGGWSSLDPTSFKIRQPSGDLTGKSSTSNSAAVNVAVGYKFDPPVRLEVEAQYADFNMDRLPPTAPDIPGPKGDLGITTIFANALYDYHFLPHFAATIGAGLGAGLANANIPITPTEAITRTGSGFAWQGIAGFTITVSDRLEIQADYRYQSIQSSGHDFDMAPMSSASLGQKNIHSAMLNFRWFLSSPPAPPPPPSPLPPPPPPPAPAAPLSTFVVFFDFDRSDLTREAAQVVAKAADTARSSGLVRIVITGHTDTVGSASYNQRLSERRAATVKDALVSDGVPAAGITTIGKGFNDPLVPTGPNVREPQNRRAVIELGAGASS